MFRGQAAGTQFSYLKSGLGIIGHQIKSLWDKISTCRQWRSGPYAAFLKGGLHGGVAQIGMMWALAHSPPRRVGLGACSSRRYWKFRLFEGNSEAF